MAYITTIYRMENSGRQTFHVHTENVYFQKGRDKILKAAPREKLYKYINI